MFMYYGASVMPVQFKKSKVMTNYSVSRNRDKTSVFLCYFQLPIH